MQTIYYGFIVAIILAVSLFTWKQWEDLKRLEHKGKRATAPTERPDGVVPGLASREAI